jgi:uncharacterized protein
MATTQAPTAPVVGSERARSLAAALVLALLAIALGLVFSLAMLVVLHELRADLPLAAELGALIFAVHGLAFTGTALVYLRTRGRFLGPVGWRPPRGRDLKHLVAGYVLALSGMFVAAIVASALGARLADHEVAVVAEANPEVIPLLAVLAVLAIGPAEELLFRGVVQRRLRVAFSPWAAIAISALIFAGIHTLALADDWAARATTVAVLFVPSVVFGWVYEKTRNLVVPALVHGLYNATLFGVLYLATRGG